MRGYPRVLLVSKLVDMESGADRPNARLLG